MATRFYLTAATAAYTPATIRGTWTQTAGAVTRALDPSKVGGGTIATVTIAETNASPTFAVLCYRGVSGPLAAQTISGTLDVRIGVWESAADADLNWFVHAYVTQGDTDTPRGTLLANYAEAAGAAEWPTSSTTNGRALVAPQTLASLAITAGDRLVVELGYLARNILTASRSGNLRYGTLVDGVVQPDLIVGGASASGAPSLVFSSDLAEATTFAARVTQVPIEALVQAATATARVSQAAVEVLSTVTAFEARVSQVAVDVLIGPEAPGAPGAITTTRTDRAVFPTTAVIGGADLPVVSTLRLPDLPVRDPGQLFLSVDANGEVYAGELDATELPPGAFTVEVADTRAAAPRADIPRAGVAGMYRYQFSIATTAPPSNQTIRLDAVGPYTGVTKLWASYNSTQSEDLYWGWLRMAIGTSIMIQDKDNHLQFVDVEVIGLPLDKGPYCEIPVRLIAAGQALATQDILVGITPQAPTLGLTGTYIVTWLSGAGEAIGRFQFVFHNGSCVDLQPIYDLTARKAWLPPDSTDKD